MRLYLLPCHLPPDGAAAAITATVHLSHLQQGKLATSALGAHRYGTGWGGTAYIAAPRHLLLRLSVPPLLSSTALPATPPAQAHVILPIALPSAKYRAGRSLPATPSKNLPPGCAGRNSPNSPVDKDRLPLPVSSETISLPAAEPADRCPAHSLLRPALLPPPDRSPPVSSPPTPASPDGALRSRRVSGSLEY